MAQALAKSKDKAKSATARAAAKQAAHDKAERDAAALQMAMDSVATPVSPAGVGAEAQARSDLLARS